MSIGMERVALPCSSERNDDVGVPSGRFSHCRISAVVGHDEHAIGREGHLVLRGSMERAVNQVENELEVSEVTAHCFLNDEFGDPAGTPIAHFSRLAVEVGAENGHHRTTLGSLHDGPPVLS
jgi:hypothetical protein